MYIYEEMYGRSVQKIADKKFYNILIGGVMDSSVKEQNLFL